MSPSHIIHCLKVLHTGTTSCVRTEGETSTWFEVKMGVRQGCIVAPKLFNILIDQIMHNIENVLPGIQVSNYWIKDLEYANDTVLFTPSIASLVLSLHRFSAIASNFGLTVNWSKIRVIHVGDADDTDPIAIKGEQGEFISIFNYPSPMVLIDDNPQIEEHRRKSLATASMRSLWQPLWQH